MDFEIDLGFGIRYDGRLRLAGVDTPEVRGAEKEEGLKVKAYVKDLVEGHEVRLITEKWKGKFGRYIASVIYKKEDGSDENLSQRLVQLGMAKVVDY